MKLNVTDENHGKSIKQNAVYQIGSPNVDGE